MRESKWNNKLELKQPTAWLKKFGSRSYDCRLLDWDRSTLHSKHLKTPIQLLIVNCSFDGLRAFINLDGNDGTVHRLPLRVQRALPLLPPSHPAMASPKRPWPICTCILAIANRPNVASLINGRGVMLPCTVTLVHPIRSSFIGVASIIIFLPAYHPIVRYFLRPQKNTIIRSVPIKLI